MASRSPAVRPRGLPSPGAWCPTVSWLRGRELQHIEEGQRIILHMLEKLADVSKVEQAPRMEGKRMVCMLAPKA